MRIGSRVFIVGAIPTAVAACIAVAATLLLKESDRARSGAAVAGVVYRTLLTAVIARNDYVSAASYARFQQERRFAELTAQARQELGRLRAMHAANEAIGAAEKTLSRYVEDMGKLVTVTVESDTMIDDMRTRAAALIALTEQARQRQHASNADISASITGDDEKLRAARDIVDGAYAMRLALAPIDVLLGSGEQASGAPASPASVFAATRLRQVAAELVKRLASAPRGSDAVSPRPDDAIAAKVADLVASLGERDEDALKRNRERVRELALWSEKTLKVYSTEYHALHEEMTQLVAYSIEAHDTEIATQSIALDILKLSNRSAAALSRRDESTARAILASSRDLADTIGRLNIPPLIQAEMSDAFRRWHDGLEQTTSRIGQQVALVFAMDTASSDMIRAAGSLDADLSGNAERTARSIEVILVLGAATGLLLAGGAAFVVARSITRPLHGLQTRIVELAADPADGRVGGERRHDELGDIARAANLFLREIARREHALRLAKERADDALQTLQLTQADLIQAEKLASLGQLVAGVAHEINTPIGIALTTASVVDEEASRFRLATRDGRTTRAALDRLVERVTEGASLLIANLGRAADLIQSFKHVAADQVSGERRPFDLRTFLHELVVSLGPMLRKGGHTVDVDCPPGLTLDSYPGALGQVVTNLVVNASLHAYEGGGGDISVSAIEMPGNRLRLTVADEGRGIPAEHAARIFDPFFTTRRARGSTGLGLHIVFNLVGKTLGGRIDLDSTPGRGSRFVIDIPRVAAKAPQPSLESEAVA